MYGIASLYKEINAKKLPENRQLFELA